MRTVVISSNDNPNYIDCLPYVQKAWNKLGWNTLTFYLGNKAINSTHQNKIVKIKKVKHYRDSTVLQVYRLFGAKYAKGLLMTSDVDMLPISNYWQPQEDNFTVYGEDLTGYRHFPMCYISAPSELWEKIIPEKSIEELLNKYNCARSKEFNDWWYTDQQIITERLKPLNPIKINRGKNKYNLAKGRVDRCNWQNTLEIDDKKIDAHLIKATNPSFQKEIAKIMTLIK